MNNLRTYAFVFVVFSCAAVSSSVLAKETTRQERRLEQAAHLARCGQADAGKVIAQARWYQGSRQEPAKHESLPVVAGEWYELVKHEAPVNHLVGMMMNRKHKVKRAYLESFRDSLILASRPLFQGLVGEEEAYARFVGHVRGAFKSYFKNAYRQI